MMDTNEVVRATIIWDLEESLKKKDAEIERLREHNKKMASVITDYCNEFIEEAPFYDEFLNALQQKETV